MNRFMLFCATAGLVAFAAASAQATMLETVTGRGNLKCGVTTGLAGFGAPDDQGTWAGLDVDFCKAVAAAVLGDSSKVEYVPLSAKDRFTALSSGEVDLLARNSTWTFDRDVNLKLEWTGVNYYDGQGFLVRKDLGVASAKELGGASICVQTGTTTELNLADYFRANGLELKSVVFETNEQAREAYVQSRCDAYTTDASGLAGERSVMPDPENHVILPEIISKEPLGPLVAHGDQQWGDIVRWALNVMIIAEEFGITQANVDEMKASTTNPEVKRMLGTEGEFYKNAGWSPDFAYNIIKQVGNYGESFERNVGLKTPLGLARGLNELWSKGGLMYAPPFR